MKTILFTQSNSLYNFWQNHKLDGVKIFTSKNEFIKQVKVSKDCIVGVDSDSFENLNAFIKSLFDINDGIKILVLSNEPTFQNGKSILALGAKGYANSHMQKIHFKDAINTINSGQVWLYPEFIQQMIGEITSNTVADVLGSSWYSGLSDREKEMAELIKKGYTNKEISEISGITLRTVKAHTTSIYNKAGVKDRIGLVLLMQRTDA